MRFFVIAVVCAVLCSTPATATENYRDLYRNSKNAEEISFQSRKPYEQVKLCVLEKAYNLAKSAGSTGFVRRAAQQSEPLSAGSGKGELIHWGKTNNNSMEFSLANGVTTVRLFKNFIAYAKADEAERIAVIQPFTYYRDCYEQDASPANTEKLIAAPLYTLNSKATAMQMADCIADAADASFVNAHISHNVAGYYEVESFGGYNKIPEQLFVANKSGGSEIRWKRSALTAFAIIKLDNPGATFNRELTEKNHVFISALKICSDIVDGKIPPRKEKPKPVNREEVIAHMALATEKRYEDGDIDMAEMPLQVLPLPADARQFSIDEKTIANIPVRAVAAAKVVKAGTAVADYWPAVILHDRSGNREFDRATLEQPSRIAYCDQAGGSAPLPQLPTMRCYQDLNSDGSFETQRTAFVSNPKSAANIYFLAKAEPTSPIKYEKAQFETIPTTFINYAHFSAKDGFGFCTSYQGGTGAYVANNFCYLQSQRISQDSATNTGQYRVDRITVATTLEAKKKDLIRVVESIPAGTIIGRIDVRNPITDFGTTDLWINRFVQSIRNAPAQTFAAGIDKPSATITGREDGILGREQLKPNLQLKATSVGTLGLGPRDVRMPFNLGQKFAGRRFKLDSNVFEPTRIFGCTMGASYAGSSQFINVCIPADIVAESAFYSDGYLRFVGDTYKSVASITPLKMEVSTETWDNYFVIETKFVGWDVKKSGKQFAKLTNRILLEGQLVSSQPLTVELYNNVGQFTMFSAEYTIQKLPDDSYVVKPATGVGQ